MVEFVDGPLKNLALTTTSMYGSEAISELFRFEVEFYLDDPEPLVADDLIGKPCGLTIHPPSGEARHVHGCMADIQARHSVQDGRIHYRVAVMPELWKSSLNERTVSRNFSNLKPDEICLAVIRDCIGNVRVRNLCSAGAPVSLFDIQYNESDVGYLYRLLSDFGISFCFTHETNAHTLVLFDRNSQIPVYSRSPGYQVPAADAQAGIVSHWSQKVFTHVQEVSACQLDMSRVQLDSEQARAAPAQRGVGALASKLYGAGTPGSGTDPAQLARDGNLAAVARQVKDQALSQHLVTTLDCDNPAIAAGMKINLEQAVPTGETSLVVFSVAHSAFFSMDSGSTYSSILNCLAGTAEVKPKRRPRALVNAQFIATVIESQFGGSAPAESATVKVAFPWDEQVSTHWIPVTQIFGGNGSSGALFLPQVGDTVLVNFVQGDPRRPVVVGVLYNGRNRMAPFANGCAQGLRMGVIAPSGNEFSMNEVSGSEQMFINASRDMNTIVVNDSIIDVQNDQTVTIAKNQSTEAGEKMEFKVGENTITMDMQKIELKGSMGSITIGPSGIAVSSSGEMSIEGVNLVATGSAAAEVSSSGMTQLKGSLVMVN
jgi:type VI secretion system secreted protein VgrG